jgi:hypothetical protein
VLLALPLVLGSALAASAAPAHRGDTSPPVTHAYTTGDAAAGSPVRVRLEAADVGPGRVARVEYRVDGGRWRTYRRPAPEVLFDGTRKSFARWQHVGAGSFALQHDGTLRTRGGLGMLWWPVHDFGSAEIHLRWRTVATAGNTGNAGVVIRFPDPVKLMTDPQPCQAGHGIATLGLVAPEYAAIDCGNEVQINDFSSGDPQRTGSVYDFSFLHDPQQRPVKPGTWTDYVVRVVGGEEYAVTVVRDGHVINEWVNTPGQVSWRSGCYCPVPGENPGDAPSDLRRFARGFLGLQNHGDTDLVEFGRVTVQDLSGSTGAFTVSGNGIHVVEFRATDDAGNREPVQRLLLRIGRPPGTQIQVPRSCAVGPVVAANAPATCSYVASGSHGTYDARTPSVWSIHVTRGRSTWLVAGHASAPSLPVSGTFATLPGDRVTVSLGPDLVSARDNNVTADGAVGSISAGDDGTS